MQYIYEQENARIICELLLAEVYKQILVPRHTLFEYKFIYLFIHSFIHSIIHSNQKLECKH